MEHQVGEHRYDYRNQAWVRYLGNGQWKVVECGHVKVMGKPVSIRCFACQHSGTVLAHHEEIH